VNRARGGAAAPLGLGRGFFVYADLLKA
jgi:hypothetical protein